MREMSYPDCNGKQPQDGGPPVLKRRRGTKVLETNNKCGARAMAEHVMRQHFKLMRGKFMLFVHSHNLKCDANIEHMTGTKARKRNWFLTEALMRKMEPFVEPVAFKEEDCPPLFDKRKHMEPVGEECQKCNEWNKLDEELVARCAEATRPPPDPKRRRTTPTNPCLK